MDALDTAPLLVMAAGLAVALWAGLRERAGRSLLGERPEGDLPDTRMALLKVFGLWAVAQVALGVWAGSPNPQERPSPFAQLVAVSIVHVALALYLLPVARSGRRSAIPPRIAAVAGLVGGLAVYGMVALVSIVIVQGYGAFGYEVPEQGVVELVRDAAPGPRVAMAACAVLLAPFGEEVFYRGILLPALARVLPVRNALLIQALLFGFVHFWQLPAAWPLSLALAVVGWGTGWLYLRTGSLAGAVLVHATFNAIQLALLFASL